MKTLALALSVAPLVLVCGCSHPPATTTDGNGASVGGGAAPVAVAAPRGPAAPVRTPDQAAYLGRWIGVEGMYLDVARNSAGGVRLDMQWDLDHKGTFDGSVTPEGLRFVRNGVAETARRTDGNATGLKYLAGKQDCLTVKPGEGYCR